MAEWNLPPQHLYCGLSSFQKHWGKILVAETSSLWYFVSSDYYTMSNFLKKIDLYWTVLPLHYVKLIIHVFQTFPLWHNEADNFSEQSTSLNSQPQNILPHIRVSWATSDIWLCPSALMQFNSKKWELSPTPTAPPDTKHRRKDRNICITYLPPRPDLSTLMSSPHGLQPPHPCNQY